MKTKLEDCGHALVDLNEKLMDKHGEGVLDGFTHEWLPWTMFQVSVPKTYHSISNQIFLQYQNSAING